MANPSVRTETLPAWNIETGTGFQPVPAKQPPILICPLRAGICERQACAWWNDEDKRCAVRLLADAAALLVRKQEHQEMRDDLAENVRIYGGAT